MKTVSTILAVALLASTAASAAVKLPTRDALNKAPRWVSYITYDDVSDTAEESAEKARRWVNYITYDDVDETADAAAEKARRWVNYITYDDVAEAGDNHVPATDAKRRRWVNYITYDGHGNRLMQIVDVEDEATPSKKERRWVNYISYDGNSALTFVDGPFRDEANQRRCRGRSSSS
ncbi:hypothetical protein CONLIGDRAFT_644483 [Coniochaeta ligniaria NRRL 30616]|uniref:Uncharacterized protein n=1 Tax=Coniochaeta ligniaria NRRL 30616 TaxID=1408157 RepID=A0A1J7IM00_9PEZI|nr:hypothetical protein CONLIGDRAFT_644483 [Coniochaeta ligniaria NRRL 30616]